LFQFLFPVTFRHLPGIQKPSAFSRKRESLVSRISATFIPGVRILSLPGMILRKCIPFIYGAPAASQAGKTGAGNVCGASPRFAARGMQGVRNQRIGFVLSCLFSRKSKMTVPIFTLSEFFSFNTFQFSSCRRRRAPQLISPSLWGGVFCWQGAWDGWPGEVS